MGPLQGLVRLDQEAAAWLPHAGSHAAIAGGRRQLALETTLEPAGEALSHSSSSRQPRRRPPPAAARRPPLHGPAAWRTHGGQGARHQVGGALVPKPKHHGAAEKGGGKRGVAAASWESSSRWVGTVGGSQGGGLHRVARKPPTPRGSAAQLPRVAGKQAGSCTGCSRRPHPPAHVKLEAVALKVRGGAAGDDVPAATAVVGGARRHLGADRSACRPGGGARRERQRSANVAPVLCRWHPPAPTTPEALSAHFSSTTTFAPLAAICAAVDSPPMPLPMMTASYSTSVGAAACVAASAAAAAAVRERGGGAAAACRRRPAAWACGAAGRPDALLHAA